MAQTENGEKIFQHYCEADTLSFASDWMDFFIENNMTNQMWDWYKWCDEFAEWVLISEHFDGNPFNLNREKVEAE